MSIWNPLRRSQPTEARAQAWQPTWPFAYSMIGGGTQQIDPTQGETALQSIAFGSGVDLIASIVSELPLGVYSGEGSDRRKRNTPGYLEDPAGDGHGRQDWVYQLIVSWLLRGNGFGQIVDQGPTGMIRQVDLFHPDTVSIADTLSGRPKWNVSGQPIPDAQMYHTRVNPVPGTLMGLSPVQAHAAQLGLSLATTRFGLSWFQDGAHPTGILKNDVADLSDDAVSRKAKDRFLAALFGTREPVVLGKGWSFESIQISPEESQFLQTQGFSEAQCARILGPGVAEVLGYDTGTSMTYANMVDRDLALLKYTIGKVVNRIERVFFGWLPRPQFCVLDRDAFLETSAMQKWQVNKSKLDTGAYTINEIRDAEHREPVEWGDQPLVLTQAAANKTEPTADPASENRPPASGGE